MDRVSNITDPDRQVYAAMITALDDGIGQVLQALQAQNLLNNTLIFFLSDNGAPPATFTRNYPLRGYKGSTSRAVFVCLSRSNGLADYRRHCL